MLRDAWRLVGASLIAVLTIVAASCSSNDPGKELRGHAPLTQPDPTTILGTVGAVNAFGMDLYRAYGTQHRGNFVLSPYVVAYSLGLTRAGASGETLQQMDRVLHASPGLDLNRGFATLSQVLATRNGERRSETRKGKVDIIATAAEWALRGTRFKESYLDTLAGFYGTGVQVVDFRSDPDTGRVAINNWANESTHGNVTQLIPRGLVTDQTSLLDTGTLTLQAPWEIPFQPESTHPARFTGEAGQQMTPRTMAGMVPKGARHGQGPGWSAVELPYLGRQLNMVLVLPDNGPLDQLEANLDGELVTTMIASLRDVPVDVRLPRFQFETTTRLDTELTGLGMPTALDEHTAGFEAMAEYDTPYLSAVVQSSYLDAGENGSGTQTGSIAVSQNTQPAGPETVRVSLDRPFLVLVRDSETGLILSVGRVANPNG